MRAGLETCPWAHPSGSGRRSLPWVLVPLVVLMAGGGGLGSTPLSLFQSSPFCHRENSTEILVCNLTNEDMDAELPQSRWDEISGISVIQARSLTIRPQCNAEKKYLKLFNCQNVNTMKDKTKCRMYLQLKDSSADTITSAVNLLKVFDSYITRVDLDPVEQFDFDNSTVDDITIRALATQSKIISSEIRIIRSMELSGGFRFVVENSTIGDIKRLNYKSSNTDSTMTNVKIKNVHEGGMVVSEGRLYLYNVTINNLASKAIRVQNVGELRVELSDLTHADVDSIIMDGGTIDFRQVNIYNHHNVSFRIVGAGGGLQPFAIVFGKPSTKKYILIGFAIGFILSLIISGVLLGFILYRKRSIKPDDREGMELLPNNSPVTSKPSPSTPSPKRPEEQKPKQENSVDDEDYTDVNIHPPPSTNHLPIPTNQSPPSTATPALPKTLPPMLPAAATPVLTRQPPPTAAPKPPNPGLARYQQPPAPRVAPPPPQRKDSMKNISPSSSSSFSDERDNRPPPLRGIDELEPYDDTDSLSQLAKPPVPSGKPSFLHTPQSPPPLGVKPSQTGAPWAMGGRGKAPAPVPGKPMLPPAGQPPFGGTFSTDDDEEDPYETLEEH